MASSPRKNRASHSKRSTIPAPPVNDDALVQIDQEWDRMLTAPEESKRILV